MKIKTSKRFGAYLIDLLLLGLVLMVINFFIEESSLVSTLNIDLANLNEQYLKNEISVNEYFNNYSSIIYKLDYERANQVGINILIIIIYFVIIPVINKGKTFGLYIVGYRLSGVEKEVTINKLFIRNLIANGLLYSLGSLFAVYLLKDISYFICITILGIIQILLVIISIFMITYRKDKKGLQDILSKTEIIKRWQNERICRTRIS